MFMSGSKSEINSTTLFKLTIATVIILKILSFAFKLLIKCGKFINTMWNTLF